MSTTAAHYASTHDRRYLDMSSSFPTAYFNYAPSSLNAVTAPLDGAYSQMASGHSTPYVWDHASSVQSSPYSTSSSSIPANPNPYPSSASSVHSGPSSLSPFSADYAPQRAVAHPRSSYLSSSSASTLSSLPSSSRVSTGYASGTRSYSSLASAGPAAAPSNATVPARLQTAQWNDGSLYTIEQPEPISPPPESPAPPPSFPPIKEEDTEAGFIIEVSVPAEQPTISFMPEVPLRATHAPPKMRKMMYSFRLDNFAKHDGINSAAVQPGSGGIEVGPLAEEPVEIEWQVELNEPLVPQDEPPRFCVSPQISGKGLARTTETYRAASSPSSRPNARSIYSTMDSPSPSLSLEYPPNVDNDSWDTSSGYGSIAESSSGSNSGAAASPTFASTVMTPAQSLGWRYPTNELDMDTSTYRRQPPIQSSLSRVSQTHGQYLIGGSAKSSYQQPTHYGYDSSELHRGSSNGRYAEVYVSPSSGSAWYRS